MIDVDDISIGFALGANGPQGWIYDIRDQDLRGAFPDEYVDITRNEEARLTRYDLRIPWERLSTTPGAFPTLGITVQIRSINEPGERNPVHIRWGEGAHGPHAARHKRLRLAPPDGEFATVSGLNRQVWSASDTATAVVAISTDQRRVITARAGNAQARLNVPPEDGIRYFEVRYRPAVDAEVSPVRVTVEETSASGEVIPIVAERAFAAVIERADELIATSPHPLFTRHLQSVQAMVREERARATFYAHDNIGLASETLEILASLRAALDGDAGEWDSYVTGRRPLTFAHRSRRDKTIQWYRLTVPQGWDQSLSRDEQPAFPMFVELHGAGNDHFLAGLNHSLSIPPQRAWGAYHVYPFGRGNLGYRDIAEVDVWEAYDEVRRDFNVDDDRQYLFGFSMGGAGTWRLGSRTPDRWAAIGILGAGVNADSGVDLARNVSYLPIWIWAGEEDVVAFRGPRGVKEQVEAFANAVKAHGGRVEAHTTPEVGHNYLGDKQVEVREFLLHHTRSRPDQFEYVSDTDNHRGVWGIEMTRDPTGSSAPSFTCIIDGDTIRVDSVGTSGLSVDLGPDGLQMNGDTVTVIWNGDEVYTGSINEPGRPIHLGEVASGRWR